MRLSFCRKYSEKKNVIALDFGRQATCRFYLGRSKICGWLSELIHWLGAAHNAKREWRVMQLLLRRRPGSSIIYGDVDS